jgi:hypothetical protein
MQEQNLLTGTPLPANLKTDFLNKKLINQKNRLDEESRNNQKKNTKEKIRTVEKVRGS